MKKSILLFVLFLLLFPVVGFAKTVEYSDLLYSGSPSVLEPGDVIDFSTCHSFGFFTMNYEKQYAIYLDGKKVNDTLYGCDSDYNNEHNIPHFYTVETRMMFESNITSTADEYYENWFDSDDGIYYFNSYPEDKPTISYDNVVEGQIFKTGDIITFEYVDDYMTLYFYDIDGDLTLAKCAHGAHLRSYQFPQVDGKTAYWKVSIFDEALYETVACPHFYQLQLPEFSLDCEDTEIAYGKKTKCSISTLAKNELRKVSFDLNSPYFKISNVSFPSEVTQIEGDGEYNLQLSSNYAVNNQLVTLMSFELEGIRNEGHTDSIRFTNVTFKDSEIEGSYDEIDSGLSVVPNVINPETYQNLLLILLPFLLLIGLSIVFRTKKVLLQK